MDPYKILQIPPDSSPEVVRKAYRKLAAKYHPDKGGEVWIFQQVQEAYRILSEGGKAGVEPPTTAKPTKPADPVPDIFSDPAAGFDQIPLNSGPNSLPNVQPRANVRPSANRKVGKKRKPARRASKSDRSNPVAVLILATIALVLVPAGGYWAYMKWGRPTVVTEEQKLAKKTQQLQNVPPKNSNSGAGKTHAHEDGEPAKDGASPTATTSKSEKKLTKTK